MVDVMSILFICITAPLLLMLFLLDKKSRYVVGFMLIGIFLCMFVSMINTLLMGMIPGDSYYFTTTVTPITEEIIKALPVLFFAFVITDERQMLLSVSMAVGIGFAILENAYILINEVGGVTIFWALIRGFGTGLMHGVCTVAVGYGVSFVNKRRKLFYTGTFALLVMAIIYHATYNALVQSEFKYLGFILPLLTYAPFVLRQIRKPKNKENQA